MKLVKKSEKLKEKCTKIFGDIVEECYIEISYFEEYDTIEYVDKNFNTLEEDFCFGEDLHYNAETIIISFKHGGCVRFSNSEWAYIEKVNPEELKEYKNKGE